MFKVPLKGGELMRNGFQSDKPNVVTVRSTFPASPSTPPEQVAHQAVEAGDLSTPDCSMLTDEDTGQMGADGYLSQNNKKGRQKKK